MGLAITGIALVAGLINQLLIRDQQSQSRDSGQKVTTSSPKPAPADTQPPKTNYQPLSDTLAEQTFSSQTVAVYNLDQKQMIFTKNGDLKLAPASLVKVMTGLVAFEKASMLAELTTVGASIGQYRALNAAMAGFAVGEKISLRDAFYGLILPSGADAAQVLANHFGDWNSQFVEQMNARAKDLNMKSTTFANITGLDHPNQLSTASDIVKLMAEAASQPGFRKHDHQNLSNCCHSRTSCGHSDGAYYFDEARKSAGASQNYRWQVWHNYQSGLELGHGRL